MTETECWVGVDLVDSGGDWVVGCGFGHCRNGSRCRGRNLVHLTGSDGRGEHRLHGGSDRLVELMYGLAD